MHGSGGLVAAQVQVWWSFKLVVYGQDWWSLSGLCASLVVIQFVFKFWWSFGLVNSGSVVSWMGGVRLRLRCEC